MDHWDIIELLGRVLEIQSIAPLPWLTWLIQVFIALAAAGVGAFIGAHLANNRAVAENRKIRLREALELSILIQDYGIRVLGDLFMAIGQARHNTDPSIAGPLRLDEFEGASEKIREAVNASRQLYYLVASDLQEHSTHAKKAFDDLSRVELFYTRRLILPPTLDRLSQIFTDELYKKFSKDITAASNNCGRINKALVGEAVNQSTTIVNTH